MNRLILIALGIVVVCGGSCPPCMGQVCLDCANWCTWEYKATPPVGCHSHSTQYNVTYSEADLRWNKTREDIGTMLRGGLQ